MGAATRGDKETGTRIVGATPILRTVNYPRAKDYYLDCLGFRLLDEGGDPPNFGVIERDEVVLFLNGWSGGPARSDGGWDAYLYVTGVDALFDEVRQAGAKIARPIERAPYGMREFDLLDPDGNRICFGERAEPDAAD